MLTGCATSPAFVTEVHVAPLPSSVKSATGLTHLPKKLETSNAKFTVASLVKSEANKNDALNVCIAYQDKLQTVLKGSKLK